MRLWREIIADRYSGGLLGILLTLSFVVQMMAAGFVTAAMASPDPLSIICTSSPDGIHQPAGPQKTHDCPCSLLCGTSLHLQKTIAPSEGPGLAIRYAESCPVAGEAQTAMRAQRIDRQYHARAPPFTATT